MKNLPIKKRIEKHLELKRNYSGVLKDKDKEMYVKLTSRLNWPIILINPSDYDNPKDALEDTIACAKVYKRFVKEGLYHPNTQVVVYKNDLGDLTLMVTMPELEPVGRKDTESINTKLQNTFEKIGLDIQDYPCGDLTLNQNWGYDKKTNKFYAHDLHICCNDPEFLSMAKDLGYKK